MTTIKDMSFSELNNMIAECNKQMEEIRNRMEEAVSERQNRKDEAINNWKLHTAQVLEDTKILLEMGIDLHSLSPFTDYDLRDEEINQEETAIEIKDEVPETIVHDITANDETFVMEDREDNIISVKESDGEKIKDKEVYPPLSAGDDEPEKETENIKEDDIKELTFDTSVSDDEHDNPLLTPFYKLFKLPVIKKEKTVRKETVDTCRNPFTSKGMTTRTLIPFYKLFSDGPIRAGLKMGNRKFKKTYPDPEETRVISADGYSPTLTYTHSDFWVWIGPEYDENGNMISETSAGDEIREVA
ncbi:MAG: hypothetical protein J1E16_05920 [Muribaculaceae bacterium]|nr:hypothetical protein [Muribaculaceae bacterium]